MVTCRPVDRQADTRPTTTRGGRHDAPTAVRARSARVLRGGTVLTMDDAHTVLTDADVLVVDDRIAAVGTGPGRARRAPQEIDAARRHRHARHDRHPPAHVADRDARLRRRLDADPVLRLVLPRARQASSAPRTSTPATCSRPGRPSRPASPPPSTGRTACRPSTTPRRPSTRCESVPGRFVLAYGNIQAGAVGVDRRPRGAQRSSSGCATPARRPARRPAGLRRHRRPGVPGEGGLRGGPRPRPAR